jgi:hypothetical protein
MATAQQSRSSSTRSQQQQGNRQLRKPAEDMLEYLKDYAREKPDVAALWCFGIGFVLGWKLKPW